ncbi:intraflagellar transport protein 25 homolog isoform X1 [Aquarana catesbeiana]|uniref:intraflagellar transport protein 25 homolog isoform X1 n=1 Tax=Aquarana catesbeiana TaxID=8400 RepID=UPI003CCA3C82
MTRAGDLCLSSAGAVLAFATSGDGGYPAQHIIDGNPDTFWTTTGMFPQEFIISLNTLQKIGKITIDSSQIRSLRIETSTSKEPTNFEHCVERGTSPVTASGAYERGPGHWRCCFHHKRRPNHAGSDVDTRRRTPGSKYKRREGLSCVCGF